MRKRLAVVLLVCVLASCGGAKKAQPGNTIVDVLKADGRFTTLLRIVQTDAATRFRDFMTSSTRHLTLFAPTDDTFDGLPAGKLQELLQDDNGIRFLLGHHLAEPTLRLAELQAKARSGNPLLPTGGCCRVKLTVEASQLKVNNATVVESNIQASNGVIHVVDQVIESVPL